MSEETIPQMRERIESLEKDLKASQKSQTEAKERADRAEAKAIFQAKGLKTESLDLFVQTKGDAEITAETVGEWAEKYGLAPEAKEETPNGEGESQEAEGDTGSSDADSGLSTMSRAGSGTGEGGAAAAGAQSMPRDEWEQLNATDPVAARAALREGKVQVRGESGLGRNPFGRRT